MPQLPPDFGVGEHPVLQVDPLSSIASGPGPFAASAKLGQVRQAKTAEEDLASILKKEVPAVDFDIKAGHPFAEHYEAGVLSKWLQQRGLHVEDDRMGNLVAAQTPEQAYALRYAQTPLDYGKAYGYSPEDIAAFYLAKNQGDVKRAFSAFSKDAKANAKSTKAQQRWLQDDIGRAKAATDQIRNQFMAHEIYRATQKADPDEQAAMYEMLRQFNEGKR